MIYCFMALSWIIEFVWDKSLKSALDNSKLTEKKEKK